jgi:Cytochrome P460
VPVARARFGSALAALLLIAPAACGGEDGGQETTLFPDDYAATFEEVRDCRRSADHDLSYVRVLADPAAREPYQGREQAFPEGAVVLKEEFDFADDSCSGDIVRWTVMSKLADGAAPDNLDWRWQTVDTERSVVDEDAVRCAGCHMECQGPVVGYAGTCADP